MSDTHLAWMDLEMTGLDPESDRIIEIATIITDKDLNVIAEGPVIAVHQSDDLLNQMDEWCTKTHGESGLTKRVQMSQISEQAAMDQTLAFLKQHLEAGKVPLCGNSIWQDRRFLAKYMPELESFFHYRIIDVSTIKELAKRWKPEILAGAEKDSKHLALDDIKDSIEELRYYRTSWLV